MLVSSTPTVALEKRYVITEDGDLGGIPVALKDLSSPLLNGLMLSMLHCQPLKYNSSGLRDISIHCGGWNRKWTQSRKKCLQTRIAIVPSQYG
jgi:hypothetical protein